MSITTAFNAAIAFVEGRDADAMEMLGPFVGTEINGVADIHHLKERLQAAITDVTIRDTCNLLRRLLREELQRSIPGAEKMNTGELTLYLRGSRDALKPFEEEWESLKTQLKPLPEHEPVILNHAK